MDYSTHLTAGGADAAMAYWTSRQAPICFRDVANGATPAAGWTGGPTVRESGRQNRDLVHPSPFRCRQNAFYLFSRLICRRRAELEQHELSISRMALRLHRPLVGKDPRLANSRWIRRRIDVGDEPGVNAFHLKSYQRTGVEYSPALGLAFSRVRADRLGEMFAGAVGRRPHSSSPHLKA